MLLVLLQRLTYFVLFVFLSKMWSHQKNTNKSATTCTSFGHQAPPTVGVGWSGGLFIHFQETWINFPATSPQGKACPGRETTRLKPGHSWPFDLVSAHLSVCLSVRSTASSQLSSSPAPAPASCNSCLLQVLTPGPGAFLPRSLQVPPWAQPTDPHGV